MKSAAKLTISTFGVIASIAGIEHGVGEILQGSIKPDGMVILSWPDSAFFSIQAGEPAMTIVPNLLVTGILAVIVSLVYLAWVTLFVQRKHAGMVLILISFLWLLVGGGFGPPLLGVILGVAAARMNAPAPERSRLPVGPRRFLGKQWRWIYTAALMAWLLLFPGTNLLDVIFKMDESILLIPVITFSALALLLLAILSGFAHDSIQQPMQIGHSNIQSASKVGLPGS